MTKENLAATENFVLPDEVNGVKLAAKDALILQELYLMPQTINDLADKLDASYHTIRRYIKKLEQVNLVTKEATFTDNGAHIYKTTFEDMLDHVGELVFKTQSGPKKLGRLAKEMVGNTFHKTAGMVLFTLWLQSMQKNEMGLEVAYMNGPSIKEMRIWWQGQIKMLKELTALYENLMVAPIWTGDANKYFDLRNHFPDDEDAIYAWIQEKADELAEELGE